MYSALHHKIRSILVAKGEMDLRVWEHRLLPAPIRSPDEFAFAIGYVVERIVKTVVISPKSGAGKQLAAVAASSNRKVAFRLLADELGWSGCQLAKPEMLANTDFPPRGVSPIGLGEMPVFVDSSLLRFETVLVGGGAVGVELEISPHLLVELAKARLLALSWAQITPEDPWPSMET